MKYLNRIPCLFGFHYWDPNLAKVQFVIALNSALVTLQCRHCGKKHEIHVGG